MEAEADSVTHSLAAAPSKSARTNTPSFGITSESKLLLHPSSRSTDKLQIPGEDQRVGSCQQKREYIPLYQQHPRRARVSRTIGHLQHLSSASCILRRCYNLCLQILCEYNTLLLLNYFTLSTWTALFAWLRTGGPTCRTQSRETQDWRKVVSTKMVWLLIISLYTSSSIKCIIHECAICGPQTSTSLPTASSHHSKGARRSTLHPPHQPIRHIRRITRCRSVII